ncbi:MAG: glycosyltransferase family 9 protein [Campylobacterales bacterium]|nr:glycosyltransferase family 9 protein [Campylobacterales bacterium]
MEFGDDTVIDFVSTPGSGTLFQKDSRVNRVYPLKHKKIPIIFSKQKREIIKASKQLPYDILINFEFGKQFKSLVEQINAKEKFGPHAKEVKFSTDAVHMVEVSKEMFKDVVSSEVFAKSFPKVVGSSKEEIYSKYPLEDQYIIISPSNSHQQRNRMNYRAWQNESWRELIERLSKKIQVVIIGNKNEDEFFNKLKPYPLNVLDLVAKTPLSELIGVIENAKALVATDTGTAHLASALNTEVFALIGPTPAEVTGPYQTPYNKVHIISSNQECSPCYKTEVMWNCKDNICMKEISVDMVYNAITNSQAI